MGARLDADTKAHLTLIRPFLAFKRMALGLTQDDLNHMLGFADRLVSKWECGDRDPSCFSFEVWFQTL